MAWRYAYNDAGDLLSTSDARGCGENFWVDGAGRLEAEDYFPCEQHHAPYSGASRDADGVFHDVEVLYEYDELTTLDPNNEPTCKPDPATSLGRVVRVRDRASDSVMRVDGRGRVVCEAKRVTRPSQSSPLPTSAEDDTPSGPVVTFDDFAPHWYERSVAYDAANRPTTASTGAEVLTGTGGLSTVTTNYTPRGTVQSVTSTHDVGSANANLISDIQRSADGLVQSIAWGDQATTTTYYSYDERRRTRTVQTLRSLTGWDERQPDDTDFRHQRVLQDEQFAYDVVGNPIEVRDYRLASEWPAGAKPVSKRIEYDDLNRASRIEYAYSAGDEYSSADEPPLGGPPPGGIPGSAGEPEPPPQPEPAPPPPDPIPPGPCEYPGDLDTLGFETANTWSITNGSLATVAPITQGRNAVAATGTNIVLVSQRLTGLGPNPGQLSFKLQLPDNLPANNAGSFQIFLESPTVGLYNSWLGLQTLVTSQQGQIITVSFQLRADQAALLTQEYEDLRIRIEVVNSVWGTMIFDGMENLPVADPAAGECGPTPEELVSREAQLLGFENPDDWSIPTDQTGYHQKVPAAQIVQGTNALSVQYNGLSFTPIESKRTSGLAGMESEFRMRIMIPPQTNYQWQGTFNVRLISDDFTLNQSLTQVDLSTLTPSVFHELAFPIPSSVQTILNNPDLRDLRIVLELNSQLPGVFTFDGVDALDSIPPPTEPPPSGDPPPTEPPPPPDSPSYTVYTGVPENNDILAVLGFESVGTWHGWKAFPQEPQANPTWTQGNGALAVYGTMQYEQWFISAPVTTVAPFGPTLNIQMYQPAVWTQDNSWIEATLYCPDIPGLGYYDSTALARIGLSTIPADSWTELSFPLGTAREEALQNGCEQFQISLRLFAAGGWDRYVFDGTSTLPAPISIIPSTTNALVDARDEWVSPDDWETSGNPKDTRVAAAAPHVRFEKRILWQNYQYDWLGNTTRTDDDEHGFYDRSLGDVTNGSGAGITGPPYQLQSASNTGFGPNDDNAGTLNTAYDPAGNMTDLFVTRLGDCAGGTCSQRYHYQWDEIGRLQSARRFDGADYTLDAYPPEALKDVEDTDATQPAAFLEYAYNATDVRVRKTSGGPGGVHTLYIFNTLELRRTEWYGEPDTTGDGIPDNDGDPTTGQYVHNELTEVPYLFAHGVRLARVAFVPNQSIEEIPFTSGVPNDVSGEGNQSVFFMLGDHLGSTSVVLDKFSSELVERTTYQAYGTTESDYRPAHWGGFRSDYRFTGKEEDVEVGLVYFGKRYYNPLLQRWVSPDPLEVHSPGKADPNLYAYVAGQALKNIDPLGLSKVTSNPNERDPQRTFPGGVDAARFSQEFSGAIRHAIAKRMGIKDEHVDQRVVNMVMAQSRGETRSRTQTDESKSGGAMWNWNITNARTFSTKVKHLYLKGADELAPNREAAEKLLASNGGRGTIKQEGTRFRVIFDRSAEHGARFRAYDSKEEGVAGTFDDQKTVMNAARALQVHLVLAAHRGVELTREEVADIYYENLRNDKGFHHSSEKKENYVDSLLEESKRLEEAQAAPTGGQPQATKSTSTGNSNSTAGP